MKELQTVTVNDNIKVYCIQTDKFKTNTVSFYFYSRMVRENVTINALLAKVLKRACLSYKTTELLQKKLNSLYGTGISSSVSKKGDIQVLTVRVEFIDEKYLEDGKTIMAEIFNVMKEIIFDQVSFSKDYVEQEKQNLKMFIQGLVNDKREYAQIKCVESMCKDEPYGLSEYGYIEDIDSIDNETLFNHYKNNFLNYNLDIFVSGDLSCESVAPYIEKLTQNIRGNSNEHFVKEIKSVSKEENIVEYSAVNQSKICIGFRTSILADDKEYPSLIIANAIFGGGPYSKLFNNVREKLSLAYYASSYIDKFKSIIFVNCGVEHKMFKPAFDEIVNQLNLVKDGQFTDSEITAAKLGVTERIRSLSDSESLIQEYYFGQIICKADDGIDEFCQKLMDVDKDDIINAARTIVMDTCFLLTDKAENKVQQ